MVRQWLAAHEDDPRWVTDCEQMHIELENVRAQQMKAARLAHESYCNTPEFKRGQSVRDAVFSFSLFAALTGAVVLLAGFSGYDISDSVMACAMCAVVSPMPLSNLV